MASLKSAITKVSKELGVSYGEAANFVLGMGANAPKAVKKAQMYDWEPNQFKYDLFWQSILSPEEFDLVRDELKDTGLLDKKKKTNMSKIKDKIKSLVGAK